MKILITGASGFVGSNLICFLRGKGYEILPFSRTGEIGYEHITTSLLNEEGVECIVHLAGKAHDLKKVSDSQSYYTANTETTKKVYDVFIGSKAKIFIFLSSVKAVRDVTEEAITEDLLPDPKTHYGKSKLFAEQYITNISIPEGKRTFILRPCMIHGPGNKGNLNLLFKLIQTGLPYPLYAFENKRSFLGIDNLCFVIGKLIDDSRILSGIYNLADDTPLSSVQIVRIIAQALNKQPHLLRVPRWIIYGVAGISGFMKLPFNRDQLQKLTENYIVDNHKIKVAIGEDLPITSELAMQKTVNSFI
jgi:nucleoside-diphosphate-sugar epimerase